MIALRHYRCIRCGLDAWSASRSDRHCIICGPAAPLPPALALVPQVPRPVSAVARPAMREAA